MSNEQVARGSVLSIVAELDKRDTEIERLREEATQLRQAVGMLTTLHPTMEIDVNNPVQMAQEIVSYVTESKDAEIERLRKELEREKEEHDRCTTFHAIAVKERNYERVLALKRDATIERLCGCIVKMRVAALISDWETFNAVYREALEE